MALEAAQLLAVSYIPQPHGLIITARQNAAAIRRKGDAVDHFAVALEAPQLFPRVQVPQPHRFVITSGEDAATVGGNGHALDALRVSLETADLAGFRHRQLPQSHGPIYAA